MSSRKRIILAVCIFLTLICSSFAKEKERVYGNFKIKVNQNLGTFCLYLKNYENSGKAVFKPLLNPLSNSAGNKFFLKVGNNSYALSSEDGVSSKYNFTDTGLEIIYSLRKIADVKINFSFVNSATGKLEDADLCIIDSIITNKSKASRPFTLKVILDTILGEETLSHFSTKLIFPLNVEAVFNSMERDKWIKSGNEYMNMKILLNGPSISKTNKVVLANYNIASENVWEPKVTPGKGFFSLYSYNDSAVLVTFETYRVQPENKCHVRFYISASDTNDESADETSNFFTNGSADNSLALLLQSEKITNVLEKEYVILTSNDKLQDLINSGNSLGVNISLKDLEYIQSLLKQIDEVEAHPEKYDRKQLIRLNEELDAVLKMLGQ